MGMGVCCLAALWVARPALGGEPAATDGPQFTSSGLLKRPADYREWIYLSSGLGMKYGVPGRDDNPQFDNVFVNRGSYRSFLTTGTWPDKTIFILEVRASQSKGSINNGGHFQGEAMDIEAHVKDEKRIPGKWAFFGFPNGADTGKQVATTASCYSCHQQHAAVDTTFVQFYPTLIDIAKAKGTFKQ
jgi:hypothetical protein